MQAFHAEIATHKEARLCLVLTYLRRLCASSASSVLVRTVLGIRPHRLMTCRREWRLVPAESVHVICMANWWPVMKESLESVLSYNRLGSSSGSTKRQCGRVVLEPEFPSSRSSWKSCVVVDPTAQLRTDVLDPTAFGAEALGVDAETFLRRKRDFPKVVASGSRQLLLRSATAPPRNTNHHDAQWKFSTSIMFISK